MLELLRGSAQCGRDGKALAGSSARGLALAIDPSMARHERTSQKREVSGKAGRHPRDFGHFDPGRALPPRPIMPLENNRTFSSPCRARLATSC